MWILSIDYPFIYMYFILRWNPYFIFCFLRSWRVSLGILKAAAQLHPRASFSLEVKKRGTLNHQSAELYGLQKNMP